MVRAAGDPAVLAPAWQHVCSCTPLLLVSRDAHCRRFTSDLLLLLTILIFKKVIHCFSLFFYSC